MRCLTLEIESLNVLRQRMSQLLREMKVANLVEHGLKQHAIRPSRFLCSPLERKFRDQMSAYIALSSHQYMAYKDMLIRCYPMYELKWLYVL